MRWLLASIVLISSGCASDNSMLEIRYAAAPDDDCTFPEKPKMLLEGWYDPAVGPTFPLALQVQNNLQAPTQQVAEVYGTEVRNQNSDITIIGMDTCWFLVDTDVGNFGTLDGGFVDCDSLPNDQRGFALSSGFVAQEGGTDTVLAEVLSTPALEANGVFGPSFSRRTSGTIGLQARVVGVVSNGTVLTSGWFLLQIQVRAGWVSQLASDCAGVLCVTSCQSGANFHAVCNADPTATCD